jgi:hypothetical protein
MFQTMEKLSPNVEWISDDTIRVEVFYDGHYQGVLYYERAKKSYNTKPIMGGWVCVDAKIQESLYRTCSNLEPLVLLEWGKNQVLSLCRSKGDTTQPYIG